MSGALIFDCDGVLSDTERDGHLPAFNATFEHFGLPVHWSQDDYARVLAIGGGKERLAALLTPEFIVEAGLPTDADEQRELVATWHREKTTRYTAMVRAGALPAAGWKLAVASTSAEESVRAVLEHAVGIEFAKRFSVFAGDAVSLKKPAPDIYLLALHELDVKPDDAVAVEDSANGLRAALAAGITTIVTESSYTADEDFTGAALVVDTLGHRTEHPASVVSNPFAANINGEVSFDDVLYLRTAINSNAS